jgi:hypothetical protein
MIRSMILALMISVSPLQEGNNAQYALNNGMRYLNGEGVKRDHQRALVWFYIAGALDQNLQGPTSGWSNPTLPQSRRVAPESRPTAAFPATGYAAIFSCNDRGRLAEMTGI